jgi:hypothetical protein
MESVGGRGCADLVYTAEQVVRRDVEGVGQASKIIE